MKIIITGEKGYIATNLLAYLSHKGHNAVCVSFRNGADRLKLAGANAVIHCAAVVHKREKDYADMYDSVNHTEAVKLATSAKAECIGHFVFISTMSVYGVKNGIIDKDTPTNPITLYGKSKLDAEREIFALADDTFKVTVIRPPMVYGKDCPGNFARLKRLAELVPVFPKVNNMRSMLYIENLTDAVNNILINKVYGIVLPMDKEYVNTSDMVRKIAECRGKKLYLSGIMGFFADAIPIGVFQKMFGSLYYDKSAVMICDSVDFDTAIKRSV